MNTMNGAATEARAELRRGDTVRVRPAAEILTTLDPAGELGGLPFMPEMIPLCGQTLRVSARADKTCDTVNLTGCSREMGRTVHLVEARCDGSAHGGCQAGCLFFVKEDWLERAAAEPASTTRTEAVEATDTTGIDALAARVRPGTTTGTGIYRCQATALPDATRPLSGWRHYLRDVTTHNVSYRLLVRALAIGWFDRFQSISRRRLPRWARFREGVPQPDVRGSLTKTPAESLDLQPGELVEVKSLPEIVATLDTNQRNRNLWFDREMIRYCGRQFRVTSRVDRLLDERTGEMIVTKTPCIILNGAVCVGDYHKLCPRQDHAFFREIWLKRVTGDHQTLSS